MTRSPLATLRAALAGGAALAALAGAAIGLSAAPAHAAAAPVTTGLPAPDGLPIGLARLHVVDRARTDPYSHHGPREIPVSAFYPARRASPTPFPYVAPALQEPLAPAFGVPAAAVAELRTHAGLGAAPRPGRHPIVVVATGYGVPSLAMTLLAEDMAAHGWVALVIDSPGESPAVELADGRVRVAAAPESMRAVRRALRIREADVRSLLDGLPTLDRRGPLRRLLDRSRIAMAGHSLGGATTANVMLADRRIDAGVDLDGTLFGAAERGTLDRPFMMITATTEPVHRAFLNRLRAPGLIARMTGAEHMTFTDLPFVAQILAREYPAAANGVLPGRSRPPRRSPPSRRTCAPSSATTCSGARPRSCSCAAPPPAIRPCGRSSGTTAASHARRPGSGSSAAGEAVRRERRRIDRRAPRRSRAARRAAR